MIQIKFAKNAIKRLKEAIKFHIHPCVPKKASALYMKYQRIPHNVIAKALGITEGTLRSYFNGYLSDRIKFILKLKFRKPVSSLAQHEKTVANQINVQTKTPTMRWIFQLFEDVNYVTITKENVVHYLIEGLTDLRKFIISLFSENVQRIY